MAKRLDNWTDEQEMAFQEFLEHYERVGRPVPEVLIRPFRKSFRNRGYTPDEIRKHRGLIPEKS